MATLPCPNVSKEGQESDESGVENPFTLDTSAVDCNSNPSLVDRKDKENQLQEEGNGHVEEKEATGTIENNNESAISEKSGSSANRKNIPSEDEEDEEEVAEPSKKSEDLAKPSESSSTTGSDSKSKYGKQSYRQIKSSRKAKIKIEKLTDSDSRRSRDKMRRRGLSPPSSSDEENLYIGWIAYSASIPSLRTSNRRRCGIWAKAVRLIFYPVKKLCPKCVKNKVANNV